MSSESNSDFPNAEIDIEEDDVDDVDDDVKDELAGNNEQDEQDEQDDDEEEDDNFDEYLAEIGVISKKQDSVFDERLFLSKIGGKPVSQDILLSLYFNFKGVNAYNNIFNFFPPFFYS